MATNTIPKFGSQNGHTGTSLDINASLGKLYSGGLDIYLFVQNKVKKTTDTYMYYANCTQWIVYSAYTYPLEGASMSFQDEPNIIWGPNPDLTNNTPKEVTAQSSPNETQPATVAQCIKVIGMEGTYQISVKSDKDVPLTTDQTSESIINDIVQTVGGNKIPANWVPVWGTSTSVQKPRTDWWVATQSGRGYTIGGNTSTLTEADITAMEYGAYSWSVTARGDLTESKTIFKVLTD